MPVLDREFFHNPIQTWSLALGLALVAGIGLRLLLALVATRLRRLAQRTETAWDDVVIHTISRTKRLFIIVIAAQVGSNVLSLPPRARGIVDAATVLVSLIQAGIQLAYPTQTLFVVGGNGDGPRAAEMARA
jgi:hypothetical protein